MLGRSPSTQIASLLLLATSAVALTSYLELNIDTAVSVFAIITEGKANEIIKAVKRNPGAMWCDTTLMANITDLGNFTATNITELFNHASKKINFNATMFQLAGPYNETIADCLSTNTHQIMKDWERSNLNDMLWWVQDAIALTVLLACVALLAAAVIATCVCAKRSSQPVNDEEAPIVPKSSGSRPGYGIN